MSRGSGTVRGFWPMRDLPVVLWLTAAVVVALVHPFVPAPRWLMIHLLLLGAVSHALLVWSRHFADALLHLRSEAGDRLRQSRRLMLLNAGVLTVVAGMVSDTWPATVIGAALVASAVVWHGAVLVRQLHHALPSRFGGTVRYYVAAAAFLPVGATLGAVLARGLGDPWHQRVLLAHVAVNVLGWMGLTVAGTLVTLWPTMLRTRVAEGTEQAARRALPALAGAVLVTAAGALAGSLPVTGVGVAGYVAGLALLIPPLVRPALGKAPASFPTWSVLAGMAWLVVVLAAVAVAVGSAPSWEVAGQRFAWATPFLAVGFGAQVLLGATSYLVPMALGGGPGPVRAANRVMDRGGAFRVVVVNAGLLLSALPVPSVVRVLLTGLVLGALAAFVPLLLLAVRASRRARTAKDRTPDTATAGQPATANGSPRRGPARPDGDRPRGQVTGLAATGLAAVVLTVAAGVALDPAGIVATGSAVGATGSAAGGGGSATGAQVAATGETTTVRVEARDMRFHPSTIEVPAGDRLVVELVNTDDEDVHDLVLESGASSGRLSPGESTQMDVGTVGRDLDGWCSVVGHRQMGMVLTVEVVGGTGAQGAVEAAADGHADHDHGPGAADHDAPEQGAAEASASAERPAKDAAAALDFMAEPGPDFEAHDPELPPLEKQRVHRRTFTVREVEREVAPGVTQRLWTFNGTAPGPTLHGRVGDVFEITLVNDGTMGHSIDFHAGALAPDRPMRTIPPGESLVYRFTATKAGVWMYHCSTMPMSGHIANGMFGAVVIEPPDLPEVDRSYLLVQSELYLGTQAGTVDMEKVRTEQPDAVVFNGYANQYDARPLPARVGERVRVWVLDAGPNRGASFHVVGGQFDTVWFEGRHLLTPGAGGSQALALAAAQGGFVELAFPEAGHYPFVSHVMVDAERGAHGVFEVTD